MPGVKKSPAGEERQFEKSIKPGPGHRGIGDISEGYPGHPFLDFGRVPRDAVGNRGIRAPDIIDLHILKLCYGEKKVTGMPGNPAVIAQGGPFKILEIDELIYL
jgi:hypothetical protein